MSYIDIMGDDDLGYDDLLGDVQVQGDDLLGALQILGARKARKNRGRRGGSNAAANLARSRGTVVKETGPTDSRRLVMGVDSGTTLIAAGASSTIVINPVEPFRTELFSVDPTIAPSFIITSILVGRKSQLVGTAAVNASVFAGNSPLSAVQWDTAQTSQPISIAVTNNTGGALRFMAALFGTSVDMG